LRVLGKRQVKAEEPSICEHSELCEDFYQRIWNAGDLDAAAELLTPQFSFRGSLGNEMRGWEAFENYVGTVREALADYQCGILSCVTEGNHAFAKIRFSGRHLRATAQEGANASAPSVTSSGAQSLL